MIATPAIRNLIREAKAHQITSMIQTSGGIGMQTMDMCLRDMTMQGKITKAPMEPKSPRFTVPGWKLPICSLLALLVSLAACGKGVDHYLHRGDEFFAQGK